MTGETEVKPSVSDTSDLSGRVVLLAMDGSAAALAAARVTQLLATERGALVHVVSVVDSSPAPIPPPLDVLLAIADTSAGPKVHEQQVHDVREMIANATGQSCDWNVHVTLGPPGVAIAGLATRLHASLIVLGLRHHGRLERVVHDETVLNVMHSAQCPVFGVSEGVSQLPTRVLVAVDFTKASEKAASAAQSIMGSGGCLTLAYSAPNTGYSSDDGETVIQKLGIQAGLDRLATALRRDGETLEHIVLHHQEPRPVADLLLDYASEMRADLIAAGSARHSRVDKWMIGSVSTELVRSGTTSVLIIPPEPTSGRG